MYEQKENVEMIPIEETEMCYACKGQVSILYTVHHDPSICVGECIKCHRLYHVLPDK